MKKNNRKLLIGVIMMVFSSICTCVGQLMWKEASISEEKVLFYLLGFCLYGLGAVVMTFAFRFGELSVLHPMLSVGFILSIVLGALYLNEQVSVLKIVGIGVIILGMVFLGRSAKEELENEHNA